MAGLRGLKGRRGKGLGGQTPRRGRLRRPSRPGLEPPGSSHLLSVLVAGCFIIGIVSGFAWALDRQLRGGLLLQRAEAMQRPDWVSLESLPAYVPHAFISAVDPGFETGGTLRTGEDGTTISRELVRQIHLLGSGVRAEARELAMAPVLEQRTTKRQLLEFYLNRVFLGEAHEYPVYGIHQASDEYFGKRPEELTPGEAATLAGLLLPPRLDNPEQRAGAAGARRNEVLHALLRAGAITEDQYRQALTERLAFQPGIAHPPVTRRIPTYRDTAVIRIPTAYRPAPPPEDAN